MIYSQEIFGPVLAIFTADSLVEKLDLINSRPHPLVIYYFGSDEKEFRFVSRSTQSGAMVKNDVIFQYANDDLPFGGIGSSGMGKYRGIDGFKEFSNHRAIYKAGMIDLSSFVTPPYGSIFNFMNKIMRKV
jgi:coniferyl-aldehyde dehydrogenase